jgi:hypothetical protein
MQPLHMYSIHKLVRKDSFASTYSATNLVTRLIGRMDGVESMDLIDTITAVCAVAVVIAAVLYRL